MPGFNWIQASDEVRSGVVLNATEYVRLGDCIAFDERLQKGNGLSLGAPPLHRRFPTGLIERLGNKDLP